MYLDETVFLQYIMSRLSYSYDVWYTQYYFTFVFSEVCAQCPV